MRNILFLPGLLCDQRLFSKQITALQPASPHIAVADLTKADRIEQLAADVIARNLSSSGDWTVIALSMGGYVAFELLRQAPGKISKLVILDSSARPDTPEQQEVRRGLIRLSQQGEFKGVTPRLLPRLIDKSNLDNKEITDLIQQMAEDTGKDAFIRQQTAIMHRIDSRPFLANIHIPTLVIGGQNDQLTPVEVFSEISQLIPGSQLKIVPRAGHLPPLEEPEIVNGLLKSFIY